MKNIKVSHVVIACAFALAIVVVMVSQTKITHASAPAISSASIAATVAVERGSIANSLTIAGEFQPWQEVEIHAKVAGYIRKINVDIGDRVRAGQVLAILEVPELNAEVLGANAGVRHSQEEISRAEHEVARAEAAHASLHSAATRLQQASEARPGMIAAQELDDAMAKDRTSEAQVEEAKSGLSAARQQLEMSKASHSRVSAMQDYSRIVAPFDGVVTWRYADTGSLIQAGTSNNSSMPVVKLAQVSILRLRIPVPEELSSSIRIGAPAQVHVQATGAKFEGRVARFTDSFDRATRTMQVEIDVPNSKLDLVPGMYADVELQTHDHPNVLTVPAQAVLQSNKKSTVLLVGSDNKVQVREIQLGLQSANRAEVVSGLQDGDRVIVGNLSAYQAGQVITPKQSNMAMAMNTAGGDQ